MEKLIDTFLNGNLTEAKFISQGFTRVEIQDFLLACNYTRYSALIIALYLKDLATFSEVIEANYES